MTLEIITIKSGKLVIEKQKRPVLNVGKQIRLIEKAKIFPKDIDLSIFVPLAKDAFPELNLNGHDFDEDISASKERLMQECRKIARAGFTAKDVAMAVMQGNERLKAAFHLGEITDVKTENDLSRYRNEIAKYFPQ